MTLTLTQSKKTDRDLFGGIKELYWGEGRGVKERLARGRGQEDGQGEKSACSGPAAGEGGPEAGQDLTLVLWFEESNSNHSKKFCFVYLFTAKILDHMSFQKSGLHAPTAVCGPSSTLFNIFTISRRPPSTAFSVICAYRGGTGWGNSDHNIIQPCLQHNG